MKGRSIGLDTDFVILIVALLTVFISVVFAQTETNLSVTVVSESDVVPVNTNFTYSATVENLGTNAATFVTTTDNLPLGIVFLSSPDACVVSGPVIECSIGDLDVGESATVTYMVRATSAANDISNSISVMGAETDPDMANNVASVSVDIVVPEAVDIVLSGSVSPSSVDMSEEVDINFVVSNPDLVPAYIAVVDFVLPSQVQFVSSSDCSSTGTVVSCEVGTVENGTSEGISLTLRAISPGNPVTIAAIASHFETDPDTANNGATVSFTVNEPPPDSADLRFTMVPSAAQFIIGENIVITYTVTNLGPDNATNISVIDELPAEIEFVSSADCALAGNLTVCDVGSLAVNEIYIGSITVTSNVLSTAITSSASAVGDEFDPNMFNNVQSITLPAIDPVAATSSPVVITTTPVASSTPFVVTSTSLPPVEVVSTQASVQSTPASENQQGSESAPTNGDRDNGGSSGTVDNPLPDGVAPSDIYGWTRYESIDLIQVTGQWFLRTMSNASDGAYHESRDAGALLRYPFEGDGFRIGYRSEVNGASFQVSLDGEFLAVVGTNFLEIDPELDPVRQTFITQPYWVAPGYHLVDIVCLADGQGSQGCNIDYIEVFIGPPIPEAAQPTQVVVPEGETAVIVNDIDLVSAPPTLAPTATLVPDSVITVDVIVSVDMNTNNQVDANEGIEGITVRAVDVSDNTLLSTSVTDGSGFVRMTVATGHDVILLIPVLGESFYVRNRGQAIEETWSLLLDPANVPGLIP